MGEISDGEWSELYEDNNNGNNSDSQEQAQPLIGHDAFGTTTSTERDDEDSMDQLTQDFASQVEIGEPRMVNSNTGHQDGVQHGWHQPGVTSGTVQHGWQTSCGPSSSSSGPATQHDQELPQGTDHQNIRQAGAHSSAVDPSTLALAISTGAHWSTWISVQDRSAPRWSNLAIAQEQLRRDQSDVLPKIHLPEEYYRWIYENKLYKWDERSEEQKLIDEELWARTRKKQENQGVIIRTKFMISLHS
jgi:hypothetical protein